MRREDCDCVLRRVEEIAAHELAVKAWVEEALRLGGAPPRFIPGPIYPDLPAFATACEQPCPSALLLLETR